MTGKQKSLLTGALAGVFYGLAIRFLKEGMDGESPIEIMSLGFICFAPLAMGYLSVFWMRPQVPSLPVAIFFPWIPILLGLVAASAFMLEGLICIAMYAPMALTCATIGGIASRQMTKKKTALHAFIVMALPFASQVFENQMPNPNFFHEVKNVIEINAPAEKIWNEIKSVRTIQKSELPDSWVHKIGFPRPLDAEIDREGVGGVRTARFAGQLQFDETVTSWVPNQELGFDIRLGKAIPPTTLDEHVTIGGPYFDVLHGVYRIESLTPTTSRLHLKSRFRLSTNFNWYAGLWTDLVMSQIQSDILGVVKQRVE